GPKRVDNLSGTGMRRGARRCVVGALDHQASREHNPSLAAQLVASHAFVSRPVYAVSVAISRKKSSRVMFSPVRMRQTGYCHSLLGSLATAMVTAPDGHTSRPCWSYSSRMAPAMSASVTR